MIRNRLAFCMAGCVGVVSLLLTACDSGSEAHDLQNRVEVAANNYTQLQLSTVNSTIEVDQAVPLTLNALSSSAGQSSSVADSAVWSVDNPNVATVDRSGILTGLTDGTVNVQARYGPLFAATTVRVSSADLVSIEITAAENPVSECDSVQLTALGSYSDGLEARNLTDYVVWGTVGTATVGAFNSSDPMGLFRSSSSGQLQVTASRNNVTVDPVFSLEILDNLTAFEIPEPAGTLTTSNDLQLSAQATYSDGTTADITDNASWSVSDTTVATIDNTLPSKGLLDASQTGSLSVSSTCGGISGSLSLLSGDPTVAETISFVRDNPFEFTFDQTITLNLQARIVLQTKQEVDITEDSIWTLTQPGNSRNSLSNSVGSKGQLTIRGVGTVRVRVQYDGDEYEDSTLNAPVLEIIVK